MPKAGLDTIPQIVAITSLSSDGAVTLRKTVRQHLGLSAGQPVMIHVDGEVTLSAAPCEDGDTFVPTSRRGKLDLPEAVLQHLGVPQPEYVALVERPGAVAIKRAIVEVADGEHARFLDLETVTTVTRRIEMNPLPDIVISTLSSSLANLSLRYDVVRYLSGRDSLHAWAARRSLGTPDPGDDRLPDRLIAERVEAQREEGAWGDGNACVVQTARVLGELADLGLDRQARAVQRGVAWLMERPQSDHNPGQWFVYDELVPLQAEVVAEREAMTRGTRPRFRALRAGEIHNVMKGHDLIRAPCGPRIMWPNGLVLDALLRLGYEDAPRVQTALQLLITQDWCECSYQHGTSGWRDQVPFSGDRLATFEQKCIRQYRMAGVPSADELYQRDLSHQPVRFLRVSWTEEDGTAMYALEPDLHIQGCEFITTRAMANVTDPTMRRFAEAHLWRFAGCQLADGTFPRESHGTGFGQLGILSVFARYAHHPIAQVVLLRALPWLVKAQKPDGSWDQPVGKKPRSEPRTEAATWAAVSVLKAIEPHLSPGFAQT